MIEYFEGWPVEAKTVTQAIDVPCVQLDQVHGNEVIVIAKETPSFLKADAMVTKELDLPLAIRHADCQVALFYDPFHHALGVAHAGWRGQVQSIYTQLIQTMKKTFGSDPQQLMVAFSPSLGPTKSEFKNYQTELPEWMWSYQEAPLHFNLWKIAEAELLSNGLKKDNITLPTICTYLDERFHSYRRDKTVQRNFTMAKLK